MSTISSQRIQTDRNTFLQRAQQDGLNIQDIQKQALSTLPPNASETDKFNAIQAATALAVHKTGDETLARNYMQLQNDNAEVLKNGPPPDGIDGKGKPQGSKQEDPIDKVIAEGQKATVGEIKSCLSDIDQKDPRKAKLEIMLTQAKEREKKGKEGHGNGPESPTQSAWQPPPVNFSPTTGGVLNFMS